MRRFLLIICSATMVMLLFAGTFVLGAINAGTQLDPETGELIVGDSGGYHSDPGSQAGEGDNILTIILNPYRNPGKPFNVLLMGKDENNLTDTMMLVYFNPNDSQMNLMSIPRDTRVTVDGSYRKINSCYHLGVSRGVGASIVTGEVSKAMGGIEIKYYVVLELSVFREVIDILGGVYVDVPVDMTYRDPTQGLYIDIRKGWQLLDGEQAEQFMRFRQYGDGTSNAYYDGSDINRIAGQQRLINELIRQKANIYNISKAHEIIRAVFESLDTNVAREEIFRILESALSIKADRMAFFTLAGKDVVDTYWYWVCDEKANAEVGGAYFGTR
ncbi:MAG: LCP family protein [Oscillospiraceae bacterium]|nr:LCP family protein [Oscillospiraceae bacterium]